MRQRIGRLGLTLCLVAICIIACTGRGDQAAGSVEPEDVDGARAAALAELDLGAPGTTAIDGPEPGAGCSVVIITSGHPVTWDGPDGGESGVAGLQGVAGLAEGGPALRLYVQDGRLIVATGEE